MGGSDRNDRMQIRPEAPNDAPAIAALNREAFDGDYEADLIERLRLDGLIAASLVAVDGGSIVGHILFSQLPVALDGRSIRSVSLAPMCVHSARQRQGIGSALVRAGLDAVRKAGYQAVFVIGHIGYYPRFGFSSELAAKLASPFPGDGFMAFELVPGALQGASGRVVYPAAFGIDGPMSH
jgi:putative acetyltransferase